MAALAAAAIIASCGRADMAEPKVQIPVGDVVFYGDAPQQFGVMKLPDGEGPFPVIVFIHGGFWKNAYDLTLAVPQADDARQRGFATWNVEYRRLGDEGGGYPGTLQDISAAINMLARIDAPLNLDQVTVVGHSAGGHLALWAGQRNRLSKNYNPTVTPMLVVGQAPVTDFDGSLGLGNGAVVAFMGGTPQQLPDAYAAADPMRLLPIEVPQMIVQGGFDTTVPANQSARYRDAAGDQLVYIEYEYADHFSVISAQSQSWLDVLSEIDRHRKSQ